MSGRSSAEILRNLGQYYNELRQLGAYDSAIDNVIQTSKQMTAKDIQKALRLLKYPCGDVVRSDLEKYLAAAVLRDYAQRNEAPASDIGARVLMLALTAKQETVNRKIKQAEKKIEKLKKPSGNFDYQGGGQGQGGQGESESWDYQGQGGQDDQQALMYPRQISPTRRKGHGQVYGLGLAPQRNSPTRRKGHGQLYGQAFTAQRASPKRNVQGKFVSNTVSNSQKFNPNGFIFPNKVMSFPSPY